MKLNVKWSNFTGGGLTLVETWAEARKRGRASFVAFNQETPVGNPADRDDGTLWRIFELAVAHDFSLVLPRTDK